MSLGHITLSKNRGQPRVAGEGVYFRMMRGRHEIKCLITRAALSELAGHPLEIRQLELVYFRHDVKIPVYQFGATTRSRGFGPKACSRPIGSTRSRSQRVIFPPS
jgi:hypothetical protein